MNKKFQTFLEITKELNRHAIFPILYGSLGVSRLIKVKDIDDIDIVIPNVWLVANFAKFKKIMEVIGYKQDSQYPHEFTKGEGQIGFEPKSELKKDMGIEPEDIKWTVIDGIKFGELSAKHYLKIYGETLKLWNKRIAKMEYKIKELKKLQK